MAVLTKTDELRDKLLDTLSQDDIDYDNVQALSNELTKLDPDNVRFSADAALISRLGRELVARQETAVAELVKNAYDADASEVTLIFSEADKPGGRLEIRDNGSGMNREQLINGFMRLSSSEKVNEPISPKYKRQRAGRKGIGRFAVQRLGSKLEISTQTRASTTTLKVDIDWDEFKAGQDLSSVSSRITEIMKSGAPEGTTLLIGGLREAWDEPALRRVYRYVSDLIQPFPLSEKRQSSRIDPGFKINLFLEVDGEFKLIADEETEIFQHALAEIEGYVDTKGQAYWSIKSSKLGINEQDMPIGMGRDDQNAPFGELRSVRFKAFYFIYFAKLISKSQEKTIRELAKAKGGIRVYRNGFRVPPYADKDDDWLGLDAFYSSRSNELLAPIGNNNFFGFVEISDVEGAKFEETSSREGLLENEAFTQLKDFVFRSLKAGVRRVDEARQERGKKKQKVEDDPGVVATKAIKSLDRLAKDLVKSGQSEQAKSLKGVSKQLKMVTSTQSEQQQSLLEELSMLRVLASLGLNIGEFTHEIQQTLPATYLSAKQLASSLPGHTEIHETATDLLRNVERFQSYASYFHSAVSENVSRELAPQDLAKVARDFVGIVRPAAKNIGICVEETEILGFDLITCPMHPSEWSSILFNFYTNSRKAIARAGSSGKILVRVGKEKGKVYLAFADNGDGIPEANEDRIFNAFFTTTGPAGRYASEEEELQGTGLGLKIVSDIATSYNGDVSLVLPPAGYSTCFRIEFPEVTAAELETYGY